MLRSQISSSSHVPGPTSRESLSIRCLSASGRLGVVAVIRSVTPDTDRFKQADTQTSRRWGLGARRLADSPVLRRRLFDEAAIRTRCGSNSLNYLLDCAIPSRGSTRARWQAWGRRPRVNCMRDNRPLRRPQVNLARPGRRPHRGISPVRRSPEQRTPVPAQRLCWLAFAGIALPSTLQREAGEQLRQVGAQSAA